MKYFKLSGIDLVTSKLASPYFTYQEAMSLVSRLSMKLPVDFISKNIKFDEITKEEYDKGINMYEYMKGDS